MHNKDYGKTYKAWISMRSRCSPGNNNKKCQKRYVARGIKVCERWNDYKNFLADMGEKPEYTLLDRIDNDGNYEPGNCRWASMVVSNNNRENMKLYIFGGVAFTLADWCRHLGIRKVHVAQRIRKNADPFLALIVPFKEGRWSRAERARLVANRTR